MSATLSVHDLTIVRGALTVLAGVSLRVAAGQRVGLVGPNGVGKSTLLAACAGAIEPDRGTVQIVPPAANVGWLRQEPERSAAETVRAQLARRTGVTAAHTEFDAAAHALADDLAGADDRYDVALQRWVALGVADFDARLGDVADDLGLSDRLLDAATSSLSGGEAARAGLAALLMSRFDIHLLDEPTNDLDAAGLDRLEAWVLEQRAPVVLVSHDRRFLERVVTDVAEIDEFRHDVAVFGGGWQAYLDERERARAHAWERFEQYDTTRRALADRAQRQREWAQQGQAKVRRSGENDKHIVNFRVDQTEQLAGKAARTKRAIERLETVDKPREPWELRLTLPDAPRSGDIVARLNGVVVERCDFRLGPVELSIEYGERIALVGDNGAGKTTLISVLLGRTPPDAGSATLGRSVKVGEIEQIRLQLVGDNTLGRTFADATGLDLGEARTLLAKFGLVGDHVERPTASLSPGERTRASLALLMANGANLLVLDEPTNHLDLPAIEQLEQALDTFSGTVVLVTHDRAMRDRVRLDREIRLVRGSVVSNHA